jgi:hypothetical protein
MDLKVLFIYWLVPRKFGFRESIVIFDTTPIGSFLGTTLSVHGGIEHKNACFLVSFNRYALYGDACKIWGWVVYHVL